MNANRIEARLMRMKRLVIAAVLPAAVLASGPTAQAQGAHPDWPTPMHDDTVFTKVMIDRLERRDASPGDFTYWEAQAWVGGDLNKLWLKSEGARLDGKTEDAEFEAYYSRAVAAFWDFQVGARHDFSIDNAPARNWLGIGFQGLAPYRFEVDATVYAGSNGRSAARLKAEYDLLLTQRWVLMPEMEVNLYGKADTDRGLGSGLTDSALTLRVRYEFARELAPYVGVVWTNKYGATADQARAVGDPSHDTQYIAGVRMWW